MKQAEFCSHQDAQEHPLRRLGWIPCWRTTLTEPGVGRSLQLGGGPSPEALQPQVLASLGPWVWQRSLSFVSSASGEAGPGPASLRGAWRASEDGLAPGPPSRPASSCVCATAASWLWLGYLRGAETVPGPLRGPHAAGALEDEGRSEWTRVCAAPR